MISWTPSRVEIEVMYLNGRALCSRIDPSAEAKTWLRYYRDKIRWTEVVIVLGAGAAYHVDALKSEFPNKKVIIFECSPEVVQFHAELKEHFVKLLEHNTSMPQEELGKRIVVIPFRPAWGGQSELYSKKISEFIDHSVKSRILNSIDPVSLTIRELFA